MPYIQDSYKAKPNNLKLSGWKPTNLTSVFTVRTSVFLASWYYAEGVDTDVKDGCSRMLDGLVSSHPLKLKTQPK